jgi:hypothetical protein
MDSSDLLTQIASLTDDVPGAIQELETQRKALDAQIRQLRQFQKAFGRAHAPKGMPKTKPPEPSHSKIPLAFLCRAGEHILTAFPTEAFTAADLRASMELGDKDARPYGTLRELRTREFLAKVPNENGRALMYRVLDAHVLDTMKAQLDGQS